MKYTGSIGRLGTLTALLGVLCFPSFVSFGAVGSKPAPYEEIRIGGGPAESVDGGLDIDKAGNLDSSGYLSGASVKLRNGSFRATISWPSATANRAITFPDAAGEVSLLGQTISSGEIVDGTIAAGDLADNSVTSAKIVDGTIVNADIAASANIAPSKIDDDGGSNGDVLTLVDGVWEPATPEALTEVSLSDILQSGASTGHLPIWGGSAWAPGFVASANITDGTIVAADIATSGVATAEILNGTIITEDLADSSVTSAKIVDGTIAAGDLASDAVTSAKILNGEIVNADINASANIGLSKLDTAAGTNGQVMTKVAGVWAAADAADVVGAVTGPGPLVDNALPRMNGTGGYTIQAYSSNTPTVSDDGALSLPGGGTLGGNGAVYIGNGAGAAVLALVEPAYFQYYRDSQLSADIRWEHFLTQGVESTLGESDLVWDVYDDTGTLSHRAMRIYRDPAAGIDINGTGGTPRNLYVDGNIYNGTSDTQITSGGKVLLTALAQTSASTGQVLAWDGTKYTPSSSGTGNVSNAGAGTDNSVARFNGGGTAIQESQVIIDDSGNVDAAGALTAGSANTVLTASTGIILDAALSSNVVVAGDQLTGDVAVTLEADGSTAATIQANSVALTTDTTGNYVANVANGSGISGGSAGSEGAALTLALGALTGNWDQTGAFDISLNNASSELKILESAGATFFGIFDVTDLGADRTYTFPNVSGTVVTTGDTASVTGTMITNDTVALTTDTSGNYVTSVATGTGLTGGAAASEGATLTLSLSHLGFQSLTDPNADRIGFWDDSAGAMQWLTVGSGLSITDTTITASGGGGQGWREWHADDIHPHALGGCAAPANFSMGTSLRQYRSCKFDASTDETGVFYWEIPEDFNASSPNIDIYIFWEGTQSGGPNTVRWEVDAVAASNSDPIDSGATALTTTVCESDSEIANDQNVTAFANQAAIGGSPAPGDYVYFQIRRNADHANDDMTGDADLLGVAIAYNKS